MSMGMSMTTSMSMTMAMTHVLFVSHVCPDESHGIPTRLCCGGRAWRAGSAWRPPQPVSEHSMLTGLACERAQIAMVRRLCVSLQMYAASSRQICTNLLCHVLWRPPRYIKVVNWPERATADAEGLSVPRPTLIRVQEFRDLTWLQRNNLEQVCKSHDVLSEMATPS